MSYPNFKNGLRFSVAAIGFTACIVYPMIASASPPLPGAIFTSTMTLDGKCVATNANIYADKADVYLNGGPSRPGAAGLSPNTFYYVRVTDPNGSFLLGSSLNTGNRTPVFTNSLGNFSSCLRLSDIVAPPATQDAQGNTVVSAGYLDTPNLGGEYKVWVSTDSSFSDNSTKTDNFKVGTNKPTVDNGGTITIRKFYDLNADGKWNDGEPEIFGWKTDVIGFDPAGTLNAYPNLAPGAYTAREYYPNQVNWYPTTPGPDASSAGPAQTPAFMNRFVANLPATSEPVNIEVDFGNVCTGAGGGLTLGYWSNSNGKSTMGGTNKDGSNTPTMAAELAYLNSLSALVDGNGNLITFKKYADLHDWLLAANAINMANMLSAQLAAMELNVYNKKVDGTSKIYAPGTPHASNAGFATVNDVMADAIAALQSNPKTFAYNAARYNPQELLKNALDQANNNLTFLLTKQADVDMCISKLTF